MKTILYLVRHGSVINPATLTYGRTRNVSLSPKGREEMQGMGEQIRERNDTPSVFLVSTLQRTRQSAHELTIYFPGVPTIFCDELQEIDSRDFAGRPLSWARNLKNPYLPEYQHTYSYWVEPKEQQVARMSRTISPYIERYKGSCIIVVTHGDPLTFYLDSLLHPNESVRTIDVLKEELYPLRGEAWRLELEGNYVAHMGKIRPQTNR